VQSAALGRARSPPRPFRIERARAAQRLAQHAHRLAGREAERAADRLAECFRVVLRSPGVALLEHAREEMAELGGVGQRQRHPARVALDLDRQMERGADQHDALLARAERGQQVAQPAQRDRVVEPAVRVEHREQRGLLAARDRREARRRASRRRRRARRGRPQRSRSRAPASLVVATRSSRLSARSSSNVSNTASRQPARTSARSSSAAALPLIRCPP
jgi:hypothetical protein